MIRDVLDKMKDELDDNLHEKLIDQDQNYDEVEYNVANDTVEIYVGERDIAAVQNLPAVLLIPVDTDRVEYTSQKKDFFHNVAMVVLVVASDPEVGQKKCWTILRACENVFESQVADWPLGAVNQFQTTEYSYSEIGRVQTGRGESVWTAGLICRIRERVDAYLSTQV